jgi:class 3 adenylate cyclase/pimeloyl-ACP methyl ester carboxylesterase
MHRGVHGPVLQPQVRYARTTDGVNIAYASAGSGPPVLIFPFPLITHVSRIWTLPGAVAGPLAESFRVTTYDTRRCGMSDRVAEDFSIEAMLRDVEAVAEAAGLERSPVVAYWDGVPIALAYAARYPERVERLVLIDGWCTFRDFIGVPSHQVAQALRDQDWMLYTDTAVRVLTRSDDDSIAREWAAFWRASIDRDSFWPSNDAIYRWDVASVVPRVRAPTLLIHYKDNGFTPVAAAQHIASMLPDARLVVSDGLHGVFWQTHYLPLIREFLSGDAPATVPGGRAGVFRVVLFTDLVDHTAMTSRLGDEKARELLREHERITRNALRDAGGTEVKTMGDGFMASFASVTRAVECAVALQRALAARNARAADGEALTVRVGINAGEPIAEDGDLFGATVILAARIAGQAAGGEILVANAVRELCAGKAFVFEPRGDFVAKGFPDGVRVFATRWRD